MGVLIAMDLLQPITVYKAFRVVLLNLFVVLFYFSLSNVVGLVIGHSSSLPGHITLISGGLGQQSACLCTLGYLNGGVVFPVRYIESHVGVEQLHGLGRLVLGGNGIICIHSGLSSGIDLCFQHGETVRISTAGACGNGIDVHPLPCGHATGRGLLGKGNVCNLTIAACILQLHKVGNGSVGNGRFAFLQVGVGHLNNVLLVLIVSIGSQAGGEIVGGHIVHIIGGYDTNGGTGSPLSHADDVVVQLGALDHRRIHSYIGSLLSQSVGVTIAQIVEAVGGVTARLCVGSQNQHVVTHIIVIAEMGEGPVVALYGLTGGILYGSTQCIGSGGPEPNHGKLAGIDDTLVSIGGVGTFVVAVSTLGTVSCICLCCMNVTVVKRIHEVENALAGGSGRLLAGEVLGFSRKNDVVIQINRFAASVVDLDVVECVGGGIHSNRAIGLFVIQRVLTGLGVDEDLGNDQVDRLVSALGTVKCRGINGGIRKRGNRQYTNKHHNSHKSRKNFTHS